MSIRKDLTVTVTNPTEGTTLVVKTVASSRDKCLIQTDHAVFDIKEIEDALKEIKKFQEQAPEAPSNVLEEGEIGYVLEAPGDAIGGT